MSSKFKLIPASELPSSKPLCRLCPEDWELIKRIRCSEGSRLNVWGSKTGDGRIALQIETDVHRGHFHYAEALEESVAMDNLPENDFFITDDFFDVEQLIELGATLTLRERAEFREDFPGRVRD